MLATDAVDGDNIADDSINSEHYVDASIDHAHLANDSVDGDNIADNSINSEHYVDGSIDHAHLSNDCIDGDNIQDNAINSEHYTDGSIDTAHIGDDQVTYAKIQNVSATDRILGRDSSGAGIIEEISPSSLRTMINVEDGATANSAGNAITISSGAINHSDTSSQASVNNSGTTFIQDITLDTYGHVTAIGSATVSATPTTVANFTTGSRNVGIGDNVLAAVVSGSLTGVENTTAVGHDALAAMDEALDDNTAIGAYAGKNIKKFSILDGNGRHTVVGMKAGMNHVLNGFNTAVGVEAYRGFDGSNSDGVSSSITAGAGNVAIGAYAFRGYSTAGYNTCVGFNTMSFTGTSGFTGSNNIAIGSSAKNSAFNTSNECTLGNNRINNLRCADTSISSLSDQRDKTEIVDSPYGLNFLNSLRPVQFKWQRRKLEDYENAVSYTHLRAHET